MSDVYRAVQAARYDANASHALPQGEARQWLRELRASIGGPANLRVLDVGSGTGSLLDVLVRAGVRARGLEPSAAMIAVARRRRPSLRRIAMHHGGAADVSTFRPGSFDAIVSRQVLCHLVRPGAAFTAWRRWLRPGGALLLADGLWPAHAWSDTERAKQPFACLRDAEPVAFALGQAGFDVRQAGRWETVEAARRLATRPDPSPRYLVVAGLRWGYGDSLGYGVTVGYGDSLLNP